MTPDQPEGRLWRKTFGWTVMFFALGLILFVFLDTRTGIAQDIPVRWMHVAKAVVILITGGLGSALLERRLFRLSIDRLGPQRSTTLRYLTRLFLFVTVAISVLTAFGIGTPSVIFGGTFLSVIIGLAGQSIFSNIIGGIWLIFFRPFKIGDTIGIIAWQFPVLMPSFPHEATRPMYAGHVLDINLMYTQILNFDGYPQLIPNGIIAQSFIENRSHVSLHRVRMRFDVSYDIDSTTFTSELRTRLQDAFQETPAPSPEVWLADIYPTAYSVILSVHSTEDEDVVRDRALTVAIRVVKDLHPSTEP